VIDENKQGTESTSSLQHRLFILSTVAYHPPLHSTFDPGPKDIMSPLSMSSAASNRERERAPSSQSQFQQPPTPSSKSHRTYPSEQYRYGSEYDHEHQSTVYTDMDIEMEELEGEAVHFCLLAEFDIDAGATLTDQYPHPTGTDEQ
jgi:hypothetical protein